VSKLSELDPPENCQLNVKILPFFSQKLPKNAFSSKIAKCKLFKNGIFDISNTLKKIF